MDDLLVAGLRHHDQALIAALEQIMLRHVVEWDDADPRWPSDYADDTERIREAVELVDVVAELATDPYVARSLRFRPEPARLRGRRLRHAAVGRPQTRAR